MTFAETYREERLINRRSRARKARIAGRIIGFGLTACLVMALRTDPQLRSMVEDLALAAIGAGNAEAAGANGKAARAQTTGIDALGYADGSEEAQTLDALGMSGAPAQGAPFTSHMPPSRVKINRPGSG